MKPVSEALLLLIASAESPLLAISEIESAQPVLPGGWSRKQLLGHLIDSASNNHQRFVRSVLQDSLDFPGYDQEGWVSVQQAQQAEWLQLVALWAAYNRYLAHVIACLPQDKLKTICRIGSNAAVTLEFVVADYVAHLRHHLLQIGVLVN